MTIIDDTDPQIGYLGDWRREGGSAEYLSTTRAAHDPGNKMNFKFNGTGVAVYGTLWDTVSSQWTLDNLTPFTFKAPESLTSPLYRQLLYASPVLPDGPHELNFAYTGPTGDMWIDYLEYIPSGSTDKLSASMLTNSEGTSNAEITVLDDGDTRILWSSNWEKAGGGPEYVGTTHGAMSQGASLEMEFTGTSISFWGTVEASLGRAAAVIRYVIDGEHEEIITLPRLETVAHHYPYWKSPLLSQGSHKVKVEVQSIATPVWLDFVQYTTSAEASSALTTVSASKTSATSTLDTLSPSSSPSSSSSSSSSSSHKPNAALIGGVVGGVCGGLLILALLFFCWRRRSHEHRTQIHHSVMGFSEGKKVGPEVAPYSYAVVPQNGAHESNSTNASFSPTLLPPITSSSGTNDSTMAAMPIVPRNEKRRLQGSASASASSHLVPSTSTIIPQIIHGRAIGQTPRVHEDGGIRLDGGRADTFDGAADLPPAYHNYT